MTQLGRPKRQVLASLVPVKIRNDPLHNDAISMVVRAGDTLACFANVLAHFGLIPPNADLVVHVHVLGLQQTDFFCSSALSLHSTNQEPQIPSTSDFLNQRELNSDEKCRASANLHTNAVIAMENQIRDAQQQWIKHQEDRFSFRLTLDQQDDPHRSQSRPPTAPEASANVPLNVSNNLVLEQLDQIEKLIRR